MTTGPARPGPWLFQVPTGTDGRDDDADELCRAIAANGDPRGLTALGLLLVDGPGPSDGDLRRGVELFETAAGHDEMVANLRLGVARLEGAGTTADRAGALACFERAAELGSSEGARRAGTLRWSGSGEAADSELAEQWWRRAIAIDDHPGAMLELAAAMTARAAYVDAVGIAIRAAHVTRRRLEEPDVDRRWSTLVGARSAASREQLAHWLEAAMDLVNQHRVEVYDAAEEDDPAACFEWGRITSLGFGDVPDPDEGRTWLERSAASGHAAALHALAQSDRRAGDTERFEARLRAAAELGHPSAVHDLGYALYTGAFGGEPDIEGAAAAYRTIAGPEHPSTATDLSFVLEEVPGDDAASESVRWLEVAAGADDVAAMRRLGERLRDGDGVDRDLAAAARWFLGAYYLGWDEAVETVADFLTDVEPGDVAEADRLADGTGEAASRLLTPPAA